MSLPAAAPVPSAAAPVPSAAAPVPGSAVPELPALVNPPGTALLAVVDGGGGPASLASRLARWMARRVGEQAATSGLMLTTTHVAMADIADDVGLGLLDCVPRGAAVEAADAVAAADVMIAVSPVHNASYSALFKAFLDQVPRGALSGVPTLMGLAGGSERHGLVLDHVIRPYLATLRALVVPTAVDAHRGDWLPHDMPSAALDARIRRGAGEVVALAETAGRLRRESRSA